jgi:hypothetical protein
MVNIVPSQASRFKAPESIQLALGNEKITRREWRNLLNQLAVVVDQEIEDEFVALMFQVKRSSSDSAKKVLIAATIRLMQDQTGNAVIDVDTVESGVKSSSLTDRERTVPDKALSRPLKGASGGQNALGD